jgi:glycosyltransferase involved in cell wall biosynthesis
MKYLHVLETLQRGGVETTFLHMLRAFRGLPSSASGRHGGPRDSAARAAAMAVRAARERPPRESSQREGILRDSGPDVHDVLAFAGGPLHREFAAVAGRVVVAGLPLDQAAVLANDYDVVHILTERCAHRVAPMALAASDAALVYAKTYDGPAIARMQGVFDHGADESLLSASDAVTFTTLDLAAGYRLPPGRTTILRKAAAIAPALDVPTITSDLPLRILTISNLHPRKRLTDLIPVMRQVRQRVPRAELRVVGGGPTARMTELRDRIAQAGLSDAIVLAGPQSHIERELAMARVVALPSISEGVPTVVLEAMAAARPVVAMRVGHIGHVLTDGSEGFLALPGDLNGFAVRLITLLEHPELAMRMGAAGRTRAVTHDVRVVASDLLRVLRRAAAARRRAAA